MLTLSFEQLNLVHGERGREEEIKCVQQDSDTFEEYLSESRAGFWKSAILRGDIIPWSLGIERLRVRSPTFCHKDQIRDFSTPEAA